MANYERVICSASDFKDNGVKVEFPTLGVDGARPYTVPRVLGLTDIEQMIGGISIAQVLPGLLRIGPVIIGTYGGEIAVKEDPERKRHLRLESNAPIVPSNPHSYTRVADLHAYLCRTPNADDREKNPVLTTKADQLLKTYHDDHLGVVFNPIDYSDFIYNKYLQERAAELSKRKSEGTLLLPDKELLKFLETEIRDRGLK